LIIYNLVFNLHYYGHKVTSGISPTITVRSLLHEARSLSLGLKAVSLTWNS